MGTGFKKTHEYIILFSKTNLFKVNYEEVKDKTKYKHTDEIGQYGTPNKLNSINSYLPTNRNRGYTIYYNQELQDLKIRYEYNKDTLIYQKKYDNKLLNLGYIGIRPGLRKLKQTVWNWSPKRLAKDYKKEIIFKNDSNGNLFPYHKNRLSKGRNPLTIQTFDTRKDGAGMLNDIFGEVKFDFAKPVSLIKWIINRSNIKDAIILDFFAGSGTTGQAVMQLNREDGGKRKFILCTNNENNIATDVTYERLHRIIKGKGTNGDSSFKWLGKNAPFKDTKLRVINIDDSIKISLDEDISDTIVENAKNGLKLLDGKYNKKDLQLYYDLAALNPIEPIEEKEK